MIRFTDFIQNKDAASFQEALEERISLKVSTVLEALKVQVAKNMFEEENVGFGYMTKRAHKMPNPGKSQGFPKTKEHK
jgi:RNase H-fold protein (predicted Holliday junction resolvase)